MDVLVNSVHMLMLSKVVLLPILVLPDPEAHVLPLAVLQAIVGPVPVCPASSRRLKPQCIQKIFWLWLVIEMAMMMVVVMKLKVMRGSIPTFPQRAAGDGRLRWCRRTFPDSLSTSGEELADPRSCCLSWRKS